jgi:hypothetical protein
MAGSQAWKRQSFGLELRVYQSGGGWIGEVGAPGHVIRLDRVSDLDAAQRETCRRARSFAGEPPTDDEDPCDNTDGWRPYIDVTP